MKLFRITYSPPPSRCSQHTEKNVAEALWATIMDIPDKSKDNVKARVDLAALCDRPNQEMKPPSGGKTWRRPKADFIPKTRIVDKFTPYSG